MRREETDPGTICGKKSLDPRRARLWRSGAQRAYERERQGEREGVIAPDSSHGPPQEQRLQRAGGAAARSYSLGEPRNAQFLFLFFAGFSTVNAGLGFPAWVAIGGGLAPSGPSHEVGWSPKTLDGVLYGEQSPTTQALPAFVSVGLGVLEHPGAKGPCTARTWAPAQETLQARPPAEAVLLLGIEGSLQYKMSPAFQGTGAWTASQPRSERYIPADYRHLSWRGGGRGVSASPSPAPRLLGQPTVATLWVLGGRLP